MKRCLLLQIASPVAVSENMVLADNSDILVFPLA